LKQFLAQVFLQLENLATHGRLLDTVRNVTNGSTNSSMLSNKKEKLQVVNIHGASTYQSILVVETKSGREQFFAWARCRTGILASAIACPDLMLGLI
jgi:hypothetical protein